MNKTILITGSTDGIGRLTAIKLANKGYTVYVHGRSQEKIRTTINEIKEATGNQNIKGFIADYSDLNSVEKMAEEINEKVAKLDVLINNAGVFNTSKIKNQDGLDIRMVVNYLAQYLLTARLLPLLNKGTDPRVINLSSAAQAPVSIDVLLGKETVSNGETYAQSKLALTMWTFYMAKKEPNISMIAVNPGSLQNTKMVQKAYGTSWSSPDKGATILSELSNIEDAIKISGKYFDNDRGNFGNAHPDSYDDAKIKKLIETTDELIKKLIG
ncbi:SDR family NAD(P)-dependent oxidoreductase [Ilyobacter polytropus]|uniref:Short-chain dehydrogenase/reductase SDR n=1 Tax=Ilyobacter polytropus (strain ATCC 51220 / DSM 2926 / LMG 16218 / CuHBu1) TaxID=572544 RepID=E3HC74_ILYPC|nr:SDR family NAD(P)-dependent oxidoreductase [Ilyobacter polytropus]ADO83917.1 short-chain dehydrogenase/reductase SDR [Ilyobacter polytropus DSM 2926]